MIITLDGPAGSGKSSTAREVARRLGYRHLDSGAFYRALTWAALDAKISPESWQRLTPEQLDAFAVRGVSAGNTYSLFAADRDISTEIRSPEVNRHVSRIAAMPAVRNWLMDRLRSAAVDGDLITDGRDMGTVVFPNADLKIFLVADPKVRAERRIREQKLPATAEAIAREVERQAARDKADSEREVAPLLKAEDAIEIDTSGLTLEEQAEAIVRMAVERQAG